MISASWCRAASLIVLFFSAAFMSVDGHASLAPGLTIVGPDGPPTAGQPETFGCNSPGSFGSGTVTFLVTATGKGKSETGSVIGNGTSNVDYTFVGLSAGTYAAHCTSGGASSNIIDFTIAKYQGNAPTYFGFYDSDYDPPFPDETAATSTFANTVWIGCTTPAACSTALQEAQADHMYAIVAFFSPPALLAPGYTAAAFKSWTNAWDANWNNYLSIFKTYSTNGTIAAFYPYDEPFASEWTSGNQAAATTAELNYAGSSIHGTISGSKVATTLTGANTFTYFTHGQNIIPLDLDWIGIDIYSCWSSCSDMNNVLTEPYTWYFSTLEANLSANQKIMLLPASSIYHNSTYQEWQADVPASEWQPIVTSNAAIVQNILNLGVADYTHVIGEFGFMYQTWNVPGNQVWIGADDPSMTTMLNVLTNFGENIMNR